MILSKKFENPRTSNAAGLADITNAIVDTGIRYGQQIWVISLVDKTTGNTYGANVVAGDTLTVDYNGTTYTQAFSTDTATTLDLFGQAIAADALAAKYEITETNILKIYSNVNVEVVVENAGVTGSNIVTLNASEDTEVHVVPGFVTVNQDALRPLRTEVTGIAPNTVTYAGYALAGADVAEPVWRIMRITETATTTVIEYADGNENMDNVWNDRAALSYS